MPATSITLRPAAERFHSQLDWLDSWHSFSFSSHYDPAWMGFGPLRVINDDTIRALTTAVQRNRDAASPDRSAGDRRQQW